MKNILLLGGSGFVGRNILENFQPIYNVFAPTSSDLNALDELSVQQYMKKNQFDIVINSLDRKTDKNVQNSQYIYFNERLRNVPKHC